MTTPKRHELSPFDPRLDLEQHPAMSVDQWTEYMIVTNNAYAKAGQELFRLSGDYQPATNAQKYFWCKAYERRMKQEIAEHWKRWEEKFGRDKLPDFVRQHGYDVDYPYRLMSPPRAWMPDRDYDWEKDKVKAGVIVER